MTIARSPLDAAAVALLLLVLLAELVALELVVPEAAAFAVGAAENFDELPRAAMNGATSSGRASEVSLHSQQVAQG